VTMSNPNGGTSFMLTTTATRSSTKRVAAGPFGSGALAEPARRFNG
jgi:hypothetical protein